MQHLNSYGFGHYWASLAVLGSLNSLTNGRFTAMKLEMRSSGHDPKAPDDIRKRYGGLLVFKLPLAAH